MSWSMSHNGQGQNQLYGDEVPAKIIKHTFYFPVCVNFRNVVVSMLTIGSLFEKS